MNSFLKIILLSALLPSLAMARTIEFIVNVPFLTPVQSDIFLTGDAIQTCLWKPDCLKMKEIYPGTFFVAVNIPDDQKKLSYKITRGSWNLEAADSGSRPEQNNHLDLSESKSIVVHNVLHWSDLAPLGKSANVEKSFSLYSNELGMKKDISVYLPPEYHKTKKNYPVIYMHDGHNVFDPATSSFGMEWSVDETMNQLIAIKKIPEAIIVAIHTTEDLRYDEYNYFSNGKLYSNFVVGTLIPHIEKNYRAQKNKNSRFLMGSSMGAMISLMMLVDRPDIFSKAAGLSMPAHIDDRAIFRFLEHQRPDPSIQFYMDHGDWGIDAKYAKGAQELYQSLLDTGIRAQNLHYNVFPFADHTEADWARRTSIPLKFLLEK